MMETNSFEVIDLGVDVPPEVFVKKVAENRPGTLGMGGVLTYTPDAMKDVVDALISAGYFPGNGFRGNTSFCLKKRNLNLCLGA